MERSIPIGTPLSVRTRLTGPLMLLVSAWTALGIAGGLKALGNLLNIGILGVVNHLIWQEWTLPGTGLPSLSVSTRSGVIVLLICAVMLAIAGFATLLGHRWGIVLGAASAAVMSGGIWLDAALLPWRQARGLALEVVCLAILIGVPFWSRTFAPIRWRIVALIAGLVIYWSTVIGACYVDLYIHTDPRIRALTPQPLESALSATQNEQCRWALDHRVCVPTAYTIKVTKKDFSAWSGPAGSILSVESGTTISTQKSLPFGFTSAYTYERAVWNVHIYPGSLVRLKQLFASGDGTSELYSWSSRYSRGFVSVGKWPDSGKWYVYADVYPAAAVPYSVWSRASTRLQALAPVIASFAHTIPY